MNSFYERYSELRDRKNLRDADVSKATGITRANFSIWKKDPNKKPSVSAVQKLSDFFDVSPSYFIEGTSNTEIPQQIIELADLIMAMRKNPKLTKVANDLATLDDDALFVVETFIESYKNKH